MTGRYNSELKLNYTGWEGTRTGVVFMTRHGTFIPSTIAAWLPGAGKSLAPRTSWCLTKYLNQTKISMINSPNPNKCIPGAEEGAIPLCIRLHPRLPDQGGPALATVWQADSLTVSHPDDSLIVWLIIFPVFQRSITICISSNIHHLPSNLIYLTYWHGWTMGKCVI